MISELLLHSIFSFLLTQSKPDSAVCTTSTLPTDTYFARFSLYKLLAGFISSMVEPSLSVSAVLCYSPPKTSFPLPYIK